MYINEQHVKSQKSLFLLLSYLCILLSTIILCGCSLSQADAQPSITVTKDSTTQKARIDDRTNNGSLSNPPSSANKDNEKLSPSNTFPAIVTRVIDGDTIKVNINGEEDTIRMILVDTPETKHPRIGIQPFGPEASAFTKKLLTDQHVSLEKDIQERDQYGRLLAYVWLDNKMYNELLLEKGLARVAVFPPNTKYVDEFRKIQDRAMHKEIGIWSIENYVTDKGYNSKGEERPPSQTTTNSQKAEPTGKDSCIIKGNVSSNGEKIFHTPNGQYYKQTKPEVWFCTEDDAMEAGYRKSMR